MGGRAFSRSFFPQHLFDRPEKRLHVFERRLVPDAGAHSAALQGAEKAMRAGGAAVSYTHLDVYKRQAMAMGFSPTSEFRLQSGLRYALTEAANASGHMYLPLTLLVERARQMLEADEDLVDNALRALILSGGLEAELSYHFDSLFTLSKILET